MHAISAVQSYALQSTALPPNNNGAVRESQNLHPCMHHTGAQKAHRAGAESANALDKDAPPPRNRPNNQAQSTTTLPVTNGQPSKRRIHVTAYSASLREVV
jgi:hypothetical protein